jgi:hypothetical protein
MEVALEVFGDTNLSMHELTLPSTDLLNKVARGKPQRKK